MTRDPARRFLRRVEQTIARYDMLAPEMRVVVALSGGPDSVALLAALAQLAPRRGVALCAAHLNHQLRGADAARDEECASAVAERLGIACTVERCTALRDGANLEARARHARYDFLRRVAQVQGCARIATGHTLDDQAETVLMRLLRGSGADGMRGIQPVRADGIIRPLLHCTRAEVLAFLHAADLPYCHDDSNADLRFLRNRIRHQVMPLLHTINPAAARTVASTAELLQRDVAVLQAQVTARLRNGIGPESSLSLEVLEDTPTALRHRLVRTWLQRQRGDLQRLDRAHVEAIVRLATSGPSAKVSLPGGGTVAREYDRLWLRTQTGTTPARGAELLRPGGEVALSSGWRLDATLVAAAEEWCKPPDRYTLLADAAALPAALLVRSARFGDRIQPLGMPGHRKLQDVFVDRKLPESVRWEIPVLEAEGELLWVAGVVRSDRAKVTPMTATVLRIRARKLTIAAANTLC